MRCRKNDILCVAFPAWEGNYMKSTVQLMKELAKDNCVLYVDYAYTWKDFFLSLKGKGFANWQRMIGLEARLRLETLDNGATILILTLPPIIPVNFIKHTALFDKVNAFNAYFIKKTIKRAQYVLGMKNPTVINAFNPFFGVHLAGELGEKQLIYYCYDEISAATWAKEHGARLENMFIKMVDKVIVSSQGLLQSKSKLHTHCHLVKNGVDFDLFASNNNQTPVSNFKNDTQYTKIIGYLGSVDERLDYDLIEKTIRATPQYQYLFVGRVTSEAYETRLLQLKNVVLMGPQPPPTLPNWVQQFDVCWIPFIKNDLTKGIYPLKINEYLAAGKFVVATSFSDLSDFENMIMLADTASEMGRAFQQNQGTVEARRSFAADNSWRVRAQNFVSIIA
jgi:glycosyltransferase involved in cell wall biosynthesis